MKILSNRFNNKTRVFCYLATNHQTTSLYKYFDECDIYGYYVSPQILFTIMNIRDNIKNEIFN